MNDQLPKAIKKRLRALLRRVRRMQLARGAMGVATVALGGLLAVMAADFFLAPLPGLARWALFVGWIVAVAMAAYAWLWKPLLRRISLVQVARWVETRHPEIQERISSAVELAGSEGGVSEDLLHELVVAAEGDVATVDPQVEVKSRRAKQWMYPAAGLAAVLAVLFVIWPGETGRLLVRAVAPFSDVGNAGAVWFEINPGDIEVMEGDEVKISIQYDGPRADSLTLVVGRDGEVLEETLGVAKVTGGRSEFVYRLPMAKESFTYRARVRKAESDPHRVTVYPLPRLEAVTVDYHFPDYTGRAPQQRKLGPAVGALAGTRVRLSGVPNTPVEAGSFLVDGKEMGTVTIEPGAAGGRVEIDWRMMPGESGLGQVMLTHRLGREVEGLRFPVKVRADAPPKVVIVAPQQRELKVRPDELITMEYEVEEDIDVASVAVELRVNGQSVPSLPEALPERDHGDKRKLWRGEAPVYVGSLLDSHAKAREVKMRLAVTDVLPAELGGPGTGYSEWLTVRINRDAESLARQEIRAQQSDARETIEEAMRDVTEARQKMDANRDNVKNEELPRHAEKQLGEAREQLAEAEEALEELAERMEHGVHAAKADEVREAANETREAREHLENTPLEDTPESRQAKLDEAREEAREAIESLQELRDELNRDESKLEELARLSELAQRERELARQAEQRSEQQGVEAPADRELQQEQRQIEEQLRQQMRRDPEAAAEMLERQAERARELAERAEELSERQDGLAQEMQEQAKDAPPQADNQQEQQGESQERLAEALQEQLRREQESIVRDAQAQMAEARQDREERADLLPEAVAEAEEALEAMKENQAPKAAEAAQAAAQSLESLAASSEERAAGESEATAPEAGEKPGQEAGEASTPEGGESGEAMAQESGEAPGQEAGEAATPDGGESGEATAQESGETPGQEAGEASTPEGGESGEATAQEAGEKPGQEAGVASAPESGTPGEAMAQEDGESAGESGGEMNGDEADAALAELAERQQAVADALEALGAGRTSEAMEAVQEMQAQDAAALAEAIEGLPQVNGPSGHMAQATGQAQRGEQAAQQAAEEGQQGSPTGAARQHAQASQAFGEAAKALQQAAAEFAQGAEQAASQQMNPDQLPLPAEAMADALEAAAEASRAESAGEASEASQAAAQALSQAAQQAMQGMKSGQKPGQPGQPGQPGDMPGDDPQEGVRPAQGDPGVPPELARLGISAKDWEKLQELLRSDVGGPGGADIPEDYRGLVRQYFEQVAKGGKR